VQVTLATERLVQQLASLPVCLSVKEAVAADLLFPPSRLEREAQAIKAVVEAAAVQH
jgi:hypothetical protein